MTTSKSLRSSILFAVALCLMRPVWAGESGAVKTSSQRETLKQYITDLQQSPDDQELREKIIKLVATMKPKPTIPEEVTELIGQATVALKQAKTPAEYGDAVDAYRKALRLAPWDGNLYFNLGVLQEKVKKSLDAIQSYKLYLLAVPNAQDRDAVLERIGYLEVKDLANLVNKHPEDTKYRENLLKIYGKSRSKLALPEDADRYMARGRLAIKEAQSTSEFSVAAAEFQKAVDAAPWFPDAYYNLAIALSKAADYSGATKNLKLYLLSAPEEEEAKTAKTLMYQLEYKVDKADNEKCLQSLRGGGWSLVWCKQLEQGCAKGKIDECMQSANYMHMKNDSELVFPGNGTVELPQYYLTHIGSGGVVKIIGTPKGIDPKNIQWECEFADGSSTKIDTNYYSRTQYGSIFNYFEPLTCDRRAVPDGTGYHCARLVREQ